MKKTITLLVSMSLVTLMACKEKDMHGGSHHSEHKMGEHHSGMKMMTKVVKLKDMQVAFDLMTMEQHEKMMKSMGSTMHHDENSNHALSLTILDKGTMKPVKGAEVVITMTQEAGQNPEAKTATVMQGNGMYHYGADFKLHTKGACKFVATIKRSGQTHSAEASFNMHH